MTRNCVLISLLHLFHPHLHPPRRRGLAVVGIGPFAVKDPRNGKSGWPMTTPAYELCGRLHVERGAECLGWLAGNSIRGLSKTLPKPWMVCFEVILARTHNNKPRVTHGHQQRHLSFHFTSPQDAQESVPKVKHKYLRTHIHTRWVGEDQQKFVAGCCVKAQFRPSILPLLLLLLLPFPHCVRR